MNLRRFLATAAIIITGFLLQSIVFTQFKGFNVTPNILLMITCSFGFMRGKREGIAVGVVCGLLTDIFTGSLLGINVLFFAYAGWFNGLFYKMFFMEYIVFPLAMVAVSDLIYGIYTYGINFLVNGKMNFLFYLNHVIIPEIIYTFAVSILLCYLIHVINSKLEEIEKRSAAKFV